MIPLSGSDKKGEWSLLGPSGITISQDPAITVEEKRLLEVLTNAITFILVEIFSIRALEFTAFSPESKGMNATAEMVDAILRFQT
jgi:hypothetical protein